MLHKSLTWLFYTVLLTTLAPLLGRLNKLSLLCSSFCVSCCFLVASNRTFISFKSCLNLATRLAYPTQRFNLIQFVAECVPFTYVKAVSFFTGINSLLAKLS